MFRLKVNHTDPSIPCDTSCGCWCPGISCMDINSLWPSDAIWWHWFRSWLVAWQHQAITWTNVDLSSLRSRDVHLTAISLEISQPSVTKISLKSIFLRIYWNLPGANELNNRGERIYIWTHVPWYNLCQDTYNISIFEYIEIFNRA